MKMTASDCMEIYCAADGSIQEKIGPDGEALAAGEVVLTPAELEQVIGSVKDKLDRMIAGNFDEYAGECDKPGSCTGRWITHLGKIIAKLQASADREAR